MDVTIFEGSTITATITPAMVAPGSAPSAVVFSSRYSPATDDAS